ncbi:unnamed protein product [Nesidiocoris tenuis]|uniref:Uncharacterized protein n=1 Tax=Nesidiocoris tenuis TaxID=355587 RepID=A0A6H5GEA7_9HEMI|nr:unnamed protein product [Nesidiocoris tenuis]
MGISTREVGAPKFPPREGGNAQPGYGNTSRSRSRVTVWADGCVIFQREITRQYLGIENNTYSKPVMRSGETSGGNEAKKVNSGIDTKSSQGSDGGRENHSLYGIEITACFIVVLLFVITALDFRVQHLQGKERQALKKSNNGPFPRLESREALRACSVDKMWVGGSGAPRNRVSIRFVSIRMTVKISIRIRIRARASFNIVTYGTKEKKKKGAGSVNRCSSSISLVARLQTMPVRETCEKTSEYSSKLSETRADKKNSADGSRSSEGSVRGRLKNVSIRYATFSE